MYANVNVIDACGLCQVLLEVLHMRYKKLFLALKVLVHFAVLIEHMYHYHLLLSCGWMIGFLETVMDTSAALANSGVVWLNDVVRALDSSSLHAGLLLLQILWCKVLLLLRIHHHLWWENLLRWLLQTLLILPHSIRPLSSETCKRCLLIAEPVQNVRRRWLLTLWLLLLWW